MRFLCRRQQSSKGQPAGFQQVGLSARATQPHRFGWLGAAVASADVCVESGANRSQLAHRKALQINNTTQINPTIP
jgi:hypothetical protein